MPGTHTIYSKNEFSGWFFFYPIKFAIKYRVPGTHTILQTAIFTTGYLSDYQTLISDVTGASDIAGMITALENISEDYDALGAEAKADIAGVVYEVKDDLQTLAEIEAAMGL